MGNEKNIKSPKKAAQIFEEYMSQGLPVYNSHGEELILQDGEEILEEMMGVYGVPTYNQPYFWIYRTNQKLQPGTYTFTITRG